jgi:DNA-binding winged helix-turn-helix (wHTH) protein/Tfp pilus assembly protein PilF
VCFDVFELDLNSGELKKKGIKLRLQGQPFQVLSFLIECAGDVVSREELRLKLWPADTFVDFDHGLNNSIQKLREVLEDSSSRPRFIETIPRRGYRFLPQVKVISQGTIPAQVSVKETTPTQPIANSPGKSNKPRPRAAVLLVAGLLASVLLIAIAFLLHPLARWFNNHGTVLLQQGDVTKAIRYYDWAVLFYPGYPEAHYNLAYAYEELSQYDRAVAQYERAIELNDKFYEGYNNLSRLYILQRKDPTTALRLLDRALINKPQDTSIQYSLYKNRGWAHLQLQYFRQAERDLKSAIALAERRAAAHCLLAQVLEAKQEGSLAVPEWEMCVAYAPGDQNMESSWLHLAQEHLEPNDRDK